MPSQSDQDWRADGNCAGRDPDLWFAVGAIEHRQAGRAGWRSLIAS